jgi:hypothetical protein
MSQIIKFKRSSTPGAVPTSSDLVPGEIAVNTDNGRLYGISHNEVDVAELGGVIAAEIDSSNRLLLYTTQGDTITYNATFGTATDNVITGNLELTNEDDNENHLPELKLTRNQGPGGFDDELGAIVWEGDNYLGDQKIYSRIATTIKDTGSTNSGVVKGEITFSVADGTTSDEGGDVNNDVLEKVTVSIDSEGIHLPQASTNFVNFGRAENQGLKYWQSGGFGFNTQVKGISPTQDNTLYFPNSTGVILTSAVAGQKLNGGNGLTGTPNSTWDLDDVRGNQNTTYYHYQAAGGTTDMTVSLPYPIYDVVETGTFWKYVNISADASSDIIIDVDSYLAGPANYVGPMYFVLLTPTGAAPVLSTSVNIGISYDNFKVAPGGYIVLTAIDQFVYSVEGVGITMVSP